MYTPIDGAHFQFEPMSEHDAREICQWRYEPPYDRYNWDPWDDLVLHGRELADPLIRAEQYRCAMLSGILSGYAQLFPLSDGGLTGTVRLGLGLKPDLCGKARGIGTALAAAAAVYSQQLYPGWAVDLEVAADNRRAIAAYEKAGFAIEDSYVLSTRSGLIPSYCMVWNPK